MIAFLKKMLWNEINIYTKKKEIASKCEKKHGIITGEITDISNLYLFTLLAEENKQLKEELHETNN